MADMEAQQAEAESMEESTGQPAMRNNDWAEIKVPKSMRAKTVVLDDPDLEIPKIPGKYTKCTKCKSNLKGRGLKLASLESFPNKGKICIRWNWYCTYCMADIRAIIKPKN